MEQWLIDIITNCKNNQMCSKCKYNKRICAMFQAAFNIIPSEISIDDFTILKEEVSNAEI